MNFVRVDGYPNYVIHPCGTILRIWPKSRKNPTECSRELKHRKEKNGYMRIGLRKNGEKQKRFSVHRLLGLHFIHNDDPENNIHIDHINGIRDDNRR